MVHQGVGAGLDLVHAVHDARHIIRPRSAAAEDPDRQAGSFDEPPRVHGLLHRGADLPAPFVRVKDGDAVPLVGLEAEELDAGGGLRRAGDLERALAGRDAAAAHADVHLDQDADPGARPGKRRGELPHLGFVVHGDREAAFPRQLRDPPGLALSDDLVGDQDVPYAAGGQDLGLRKLGAGDPDGVAGLELTPGDRDALVRFEVRTEFGGAAREEVGHQAQVALHGRRIDDQRRRRYERCRLPDQVCHGLFISFIGRSIPNPERPNRPCRREGGLDAVPATTREPPLLCPGLCINPFLGVVALKDRKLRRIKDDRDGLE